MEVIVVQFDWKKFRKVGCDRFGRSFYQVARFSIVRPNLEEPVGAICTGGFVLMAQRCLEKFFRQNLSH